MSANDVVNNVANANSQDLTEQWKKGELKWHQSYYCQNQKGEVTSAICLGDSELYSEELGGTLNQGYWEVLAPVPSYKELQEEQKSLKVLAEAYCKEKEENQQLKELLKLCKESIENYRSGKNHNFTADNIVRMIDNAIGEK